MKKRNVILLSIAAAAMFIFVTSYKKILSSFLPAWEGFRSRPYWDYKQWSWGYGTRVPGSTSDPLRNPGGQISESQAMIDALNYVNADYEFLKNYITRPLKPQQWAAILSFSYNLGRANALNLVANINTDNDLLLGQQWGKYIYAGGLISDTLIRRRRAEWELWTS